MDNPFGVRRVQGVGNLDGRIEQIFEFQWAGLKALFERQTLQEFHGDEGLALVLANLVNRADSGMIQRRCGTRFAAETLQRRGGLRQVRRQELEGHLPAEKDVFSLVDNTHTSATQLFQNAVMRNGIADQCPWPPRTGSGAKFLTLRVCLGKRLLQAPSRFKI